MLGKKKNKKKIMKGSSICPTCKTSDLKPYAQDRCKCLSVDVICKNGHVSHGMLGGKLQPGVTHPEKEATFKEMAIFFGVMLLISVIIIYFGSSAQWNFDHIKKFYL